MDIFIFFYVLGAAMLLHGIHFRMKVESSDVLEVVAKAIVYLAGLGGYCLAGVLLGKIV